MSLPQAVVLQNQTWPKRTREPSRKFEFHRTSDLVELSIKRRNPLQIADPQKCSMPVNCGICPYKPTTRNESFPSEPSAACSITTNSSPICTSSNSARVLPNTTSAGPSGRSSDNHGPQSPHPMSTSPDFHALDLRLINARSDSLLITNQPPSMDTRSQARMPSRSSSRNCVGRNDK